MQIFIVSFSGKLLALKLTSGARPLRLCKLMGISQERSEMMHLQTDPLSPIEQALLEDLSSLLCR